jgi:TPR repeat protein
MTNGGSPPRRRATKFSAGVGIVGTATALLLAVNVAADPISDGRDAHLNVDPASAAARYLPNAERGDPAAEYALGSLYARGEVVARNYASAMNWFRRAAEQGNPGAEYALGMLYDEGLGAHASKTVALGWYQTAAHAGYADAEKKIADAYSRGDGLPLDDAKALYWYELAAIQGDAEAQYRTAVLYLKRAEGDAVASPKYTEQDLKRVMDEVFGAGKWRETGGYRTQQRESELRAEGALTVPSGARSAHSIGRPGAAGAYDLVVRNMSPSDAAIKLRSEGLRFKKLYPESSHGSQGAHLHLEPLVGGQADAQRPEPARDDSRLADLQKARLWLALAAHQGYSSAREALIKLPQS